MTTFERSPCGTDMRHARSIFAWKQSASAIIIDDHALARDEAVLAVDRRDQSRVRHRLSLSGRPSKKSTLPLSVSLPSCVSRMLMDRTPSVLVPLADLEIVEVVRWV